MFKTVTVDSGANFPITGWFALGPSRRFKDDDELIVAYTSCVLAMLVTDMANDITNSIKNLIIVFNYKDYVFRDFKDNWYCP